MGGAEENIETYVAEACSRVIYYKLKYGVQLNETGLLLDRSLGQA